MAETTVLRRRLHMMADLAGYSSLLGPLQAQRQADMLSLLEAAAAAAGLDPGSWYRQATGDGLFAVLPEGTDTARAVIDFIRELDTALSGYGGSQGAEPRLQLRVALTVGASQRTQHGWAGQGVVAVARLADAPVVKEVLAGSPRANMAVVIDHSLYEDLAAQHLPGFRPDAWARVRIRAKELDADAFLSVPGISPAVSLPASRSEPGHQGRDPAWARTADVSGPRWLVSAPAGTDLRPLVAGLRERGILPYVMSDVARLGENIVQALQDAVLVADRVIVVLGDAERSLNSAFEAGLAAALGKPLVVIAPPGVTIPSDLAGFLTVRARPDEMDAIHFALDQAEALIPATAPHVSAPGNALGARADDLLGLADEIHAFSSPMKP
jgi:class 3 adenylate cyclase